MHRRLLFLAAAVPALALAGPALAGSPTLHGVVGPSFVISLKDGAGKAVNKLKPGSYTFKIDDKASIHNFHLSGPGVDKKTDVGGTGSTTWTVTLKKGTYTFLCDPHSSTLHGSFKVG